MIIHRAWSHKVGGSGVSGWVPADFLDKIDSVPSPAGERVDNDEADENEAAPSSPTPTSPSVSVAPGTCAGCGEATTERIITAAELQYHPDCFTCVVCEAKLAGEKYVPFEGKIYCEKDYEIKFNPKCGHCGVAISGQYTMALDQAWCVDHFVCSVCETPLQGSCRHKDGKPYCEEHFLELFASSCARCQKPITGQLFQARDNKYHVECFLCTHGDHAIEAGQSFNLHENLLYCANHFQELFIKKCVTCQEAVTGQYMKIGDNAYHPDCWQCGTCSVKLTSETAINLKTGCYCKTCGIPSTPPPAAAAAVSPAPLTPESPKALKAPEIKLHTPKAHDYSNPSSPTDSSSSVPAPTRSPAPASVRSSLSSSSSSPFHARANKKANLTPEEEKEENLNAKRMSGAYAAKRTSGNKSSRSTKTATPASKPVKSGDFFLYLFFSFLSLTHSLFLPNMFTNTINDISYI